MVRLLKMLLVVPYIKWLIQRAAAVQTKHVNFKLRVRPWGWNDTKHIIHQAIPWGQRGKNLEFFSLWEKCLYCFALRLRQRSTWPGNVARQEHQQFKIWLFSCLNVGKIILCYKIQYPSTSNHLLCCENTGPVLVFQTTSQFQLQPPSRMSKNSLRKFAFRQTDVSMSLVWCNYPPSAFWSLPLNMHLLHII